MKAQHVETIVAIADAGSLRGAADKLGKTQPALTKVLRQVEEDLGGAIFQRSSQGVLITELGERILSRCRSIASEIGRLNDEVAQLRGEQTGDLHVGLSPLAAIKIIPRALEMFTGTYPGIRVHLTSGLFPNALRPLRDGKTDILIGPKPLQGAPRDIHVERLLDTPVVAITSARSPFRNARKLTDLTSAPWIMIGSQTGPGDIFTDNFNAVGLKPPEAAFTSESYFGALALVQHLDAVCTFPLRLLNEMQKSWDIVQLDLDQSFPTLHVSLMTRTSTPLTPAGDALVNCIRKQVAMLENSEK